MTTENIQPVTTEQQDFSSSGNSVMSPRLGEPLQDFPETQEFQTGQVLTIANGHFVHDIYTAFVAPLLPVLMERLSLSLTLAGSLTAIQQFPALLNPFIGYLADKVSLRYFVILAPAITATLISSLGWAPNYFTLAILLFVTGISIACFHAPAPAMVARISGRKVGLGMSLFMAGGELGRTVGPLLAVWAVSTLTMDGFYKIMVLGWAASFLLFWRLRDLPPITNGPKISLRAISPVLARVFIPLILINLFRNFIFVCLTIYLPTYISQGGASLWIAGASLSVLEFAGVGGALLSGTLSDRFGRKSVLVIATASASLFLVLFINLQGWILIPILLALGFTALSTTPVMMAIVQEQLPNHRAVGNGLFMSINFLLLPIATLTIGFVGENYGLRTAYFWSAIVATLAIPAILRLPVFQKSEPIQ
jgi:MFS transporter, FSR family, fosmidomycin resistance protein